MMEARGKEGAVAEVVAEFSESFHHNWWQNFANKTF